MNDQPRDVIDCGSSLARQELIFLITLLVELGDSIDPGADLSGSLGFSDVYFLPAPWAGDFIQLEKPSVSLLEYLGTLRARALKLVRHRIEMADDHTPTRELLPTLLPN
jgi:hypothetical protein